MGEVRVSERMRRNETSPAQVKQQAKEINKGHSEKSNVRAACTRKGVRYWNNRYQ